MSKIIKKAEKINQMERHMEKSNGNKIYCWWFLLVIIQYIYQCNTQCIKLYWQIVNNMRKPLAGVHQRCIYIYVNTYVYNVRYTIYNIYTYIFFAHRFT